MVSVNWPNVKARLSPLVPRQPAAFRPCAAPGNTKKTCARFIPTASGGFPQVIPQVVPRPKAAWKTKWKTRENSVENGLKVPSVTGNAEKLSTKCGHEAVGAGHSPAPVGLRPQKASFSSTSQLARICSTLGSKYTGSGSSCSSGSGPRQRPSPSASTRTRSR